MIAIKETQRSFGPISSVQVKKCLKNEDGFLKSDMLLLLAI